jgi:hypothetical protein
VVPEGEVSNAIEAELDIHLLCACLTVSRNALSEGLQPYARILGQANARLKRAKRNAHDHDEALFAVGSLIQGWKKLDAAHKSITEELESAEEALRLVEAKETT